jgi:SAM-dependent methyltransferase
VKLYGELAEWWPLVSPPKDYAEEAAFFHRLLSESSNPPPLRVLELGSGGGSNAFHLKAHYVMTLTDISSDMLAVSRDLNPECKHVIGDMRTLRLGRTFDAVFVHDAIDYMASESDLRAALETARVHCKAGGTALFVPDHVRETFVASTHWGGEDGVERSLRYLEWTYDPDPSDTTYVVDFAFLLREADGATSVVRDRHISGLFAREEWLGFLRDAGFTPQVMTDGEGHDLFLAKRPVLRHRAAPGSEDSRAQR